jgi:hypothetical protein
MKKLVSVLFALMLVAFSVVPAFAVSSPQASTYKYVVNVVPSEGGDGAYEFVTEIDQDGKQHVQITPVENEGYIFDHWVIDGPYSTDNNLTDSTMNIIITGDVQVTPYYVKKTDSSSTDSSASTSSTSSTSATSATVKKDTNSTSPQTGSNDAIAYTIAILATAACAVAVLKLVKSK